jgi:dephospho-CoA kinase
MGREKPLGSSGFFRVGLTGGIGSGKSAVASFFAAWGATIIDADVLAREVVASGTPGLAAIAAAWPQAIAPDGSLDRATLARIVFDDAAARAALNAIVHPRVRERGAELEAGAPRGAIVVHVVPLLFEGEFWRTCDRTVLVVAPREVRIARVMRRDGWTREAIEARMAAQIDPEIARTRAGITIDNDADIATLETRSRAAYDRLVDWARA